MTELGVARWEFAVTTSVHFLFVALTLGLVTVVAVLETRHALRPRADTARHVQFWGQLYVVNYVLGIASGIVMEFQLGLDWAGLSELVGGIFGAPLAMETMIAFFVESTLLGIWIFGWDRMGRVAHTVVIWLVTATAYLSAFWIMMANAFLHHPVGYAIRDGKGVLTDFAALVGNPNLVLALPHVLAAGLTVGGWFLVGISAWHLRRGRDVAFFASSLRAGLPIATLASAGMVVTGALQFGVFAMNPAKAADWHGDPGELAAVQADMVATYGPGDYLPPAWIHWAGDTMLYSGVVLTLAGLVASALLVRGRLLRLRGPLWLLTVLMFVPFVAVLAGWVWREVGRQPWVVYGVLRTDQAVSGVGVASVTISFVVFGVLLAVLAAADWRLLSRIAGRGPSTTFWTLPSDDPALDAVTR